MSRPARRDALTNDAFIYTDPVFSPDGTRVAYVSTKPNGYFNVYIRPIKDGQWAGDEIAVSTGQQVPQLASVLRRRGPAHHAGVDARRQAAAARLEPRRARSGRATSGCVPAVGRRHGRCAVGGRRADALSRAAGRLDRRQAVRLFVHSRRGRSVLEPLRAAGRRRRAVQADVLRARRVPPALVARRRVDRVHRQPRRACRSSRCSKSTAARIESCASSIADGSGRWACFRCGPSTRADSRPAHASISRRPTASSTRPPTRTRVSARRATGCFIPPASSASSCRSGRRG